MPASSATTVDVRAVMERPGATMPLTRRVDVPADLTDELVVLGPQAQVEGIIERVVDGLLVRGAVTTPARLSCARCLTPTDAHLRADVVELFTADDADADEETEPGYAIVDATIDLETMLRDALAEVVPVRPLCRPDCAGLCPTCGADRNVAGADACDGHPDDHDPRWAALTDLRLPDSN